MRWRLGIFLGLLAAGLRADPPPKVFPHPDRIRYDGQCLTINGRDTFIFSGSFHYFRCPQPLWRERFKRLKEAGCNTVETYVPWNWHERRQPASPDDYSQVDLREFQDWLHMAQDEFSFYTIIRPGPYICAEWDGGGFPRWLLTQVPVGALRSDNPAFLAWSRHWLKAVCPVIAAGQVTRRPPGHGGVILVQLENEYDLYQPTPASQRAPHLRALYDAALASGIDVPLFTCLTREARESSDPELAQVFDAVNSYPRFDLDQTQQKVREVLAMQPDAPAMISELQGGWFGQVGGLLSEDQPGLTPAQLTADTLVAIQEGATVLNYYMVFGGTNFGLWAARDQTESYDYDAPIREPGGVGEKYRALAGLGRFLQAHGQALARAHTIPCEAESGSPDVVIAARRDRAAGTYLFFRNRSLDTAKRSSAVIWLQRQGETRIDYDLAPFGFKVLYLPPHEKDPLRGTWYPEAVAGPARPSVLPAAVRPSVAQMRLDPGGGEAVPAPAGVLLPELGVDDARTVTYVTRVTLDARQAGAFDRLHVTAYPGDIPEVEINGRILGAAEGDLPLGDALHPGENSIRVLYIQGGQANFGPAIQDHAGLRSAELRSSSSGVEALGVAWQLERELGGSLQGWPALPAGGAAGWTSIALDTARPLAKRGGLAEAPAGPAPALAVWHRVEFALPAASAQAWIPWHARIDAAGDGQIYLNGHDLGRYWEQGPQREYYLPECWLLWGAGRTNVLTLALSPAHRGVRLRAVEIAPYAEQAEVRSAGPTAPESIKPPERAPGRLR